MVQKRSRREWALLLAERGWSVFPLVPRFKAAVYSDGSGIPFLKYCTTDPKKINEFFDVDENINYGVVPPRFGCVVDVDNKNGKDGSAFLRSIEADQPLEEWISDGGFRVRSPTGGYHIYLDRLPEEIGNSNSGWDYINESIDIRGCHGYVVGPGSVTDDGEYECVSDDPPIAAPKWAVKRLQFTSSDPGSSPKPVVEPDQDYMVIRAKESLAARKPAVAGQNGDSVTYRTLLMLKDVGISGDLALELLTEPILKNPQTGEMESWNDRCSPPWSYDELAKKRDNAYRYGTEALGSASPELLELFDETFKDFIVTDLAVEVRKKLDAKDKIAFFGSELMQRTHRREYLVPKFFLATGVNGILAPYSTGKTVVLLDLAMRMVYDEGSWHDQSLKEEFAVVYFCGEDDEGFQEQMLAWHKHHEVTPDPSRFCVVVGVPNLEDPLDVTEWGRWIKDRFPGKRVAVFIDTWQRAVTSSENDDIAMRKAVKNTEDLRRYLDGPIVLAFHPPKNNQFTISGSQHVSNMLQAILHLNKGADGETRRLSVNKMKGKGEGCELIFRFEEVLLGEIDEHGEPRSGVVLKKIGGIGVAGSPSKEAVAHDKMERLKQAYARLILDFVDDEEEHGRKVSKNSVSRFIQDNRETNVVEELKTAGTSGLARNTILKHLDLFFDDKSRTPVFVDGERGLVYDGKTFEAFEIPLDSI